MDHHSPLILIYDLLCYSGYTIHARCNRRNAQRTRLSGLFHSFKQLAKISEKEILALHGVGANAIPKLIAVLTKNGLTFRG